MLLSLVNGTSVTLALAKEILFLATLLHETENSTLSIFLGGDTSDVSF